MIWYTDMHTRERFSPLFRNCGSVVATVFLSLSLLCCHPDQTDTPPQKTEPIQPIESTVYMVCAISKHSSTYDKTLKIYKETFRKLGFNNVVIDTPSTLRAQAELKSKKADGDCGRLGNFIELSGLKNVVKVPVIVAKSSINAYSLQAHDIENTTGRLAMLRGNYAQTLGNTSFENRSIMYISGYEQGIKVLIAERVQFLVGDDFLIDPLLTRYNIESVYRYPLRNMNYWPYFQQAFYDRFGKKLDQALQEALANNGGVLKLSTRQVSP